MFSEIFLYIDVLVQCASTNICLLVNQLHHQIIYYIFIRESELLFCCFRFRKVPSIIIIIFFKVQYLMYIEVRVQWTIIGDHGRSLLVAIPARQQDRFT